MAWNTQHGRCLPQRVTEAAWDGKDQAGLGWGRKMGFRGKVRVGLRNRINWYFWLSGGKLINFKKAMINSWNMLKACSRRKQNHSTLPSSMKNVSECRQLAQQLRKMSQVFVIK